jgi:hypothetical protein
MFWNYLSILPLLLFYFLFIIFLYIIYSAIKSKRNRYFRIAVIALFAGISFLYSIFLYEISVEFLPISYKLIKSCRETTKTFEYAGCSVKYKHIEKSPGCYPCGGVMPCISGFEHNEQINILDCLCSSGKTEEAIKFRDNYLKDEYNDVCNDKPEPIHYM